MITPADLDLYVQRHAPFPEDNAWTLTNDTTGAAIDITGATIVLEVRDYEGKSGDPLLSISTAGSSPNSRIVITNGAAGQFRPIVTEADHEALVAAPSADAVTLQSKLRLRYDIKVTPASGVTFIAARGFYYVQTGVTL